MKRTLSAAVLVVFLGAGRGAADYLEIKVDLKHASPYAAPPMGNAQGNQGGAGQAGALGQAGGFGQAGGGNKGGQLGIMGAAPPAGGQLGIMGAPAPAGGQLGIMGAPPPAGQLGIMGGGQAGNSPPKFEPPEHLWVSVYLELKGPLKVSTKVPLVEIDHQWGKKTLIPSQVPFIQAQPIQKVPLSMEFARILKKWHAAKDGKDAKVLVKLAFWTWSHGLMKEFHTTIDELKKVDPKHAVVAAYLKIQNQLNAPLTENDPKVKAILEELQVEGYRTVASEKGHYALLANSPPGAANDANIKRRLGRLEETMESFYYWFALQDNVPIPAMPRYRLLVQLVNDRNDFLQRYQSWGSIPMLGEGFTPRRDNIMILAAKRLDETYALLEAKTHGWEQKMGVTADELVHGDIWKRSAANIPFAIVQTVAVVQKAMEEESERTTISHEGIRQLLAATALLPRNVTVPEWVQEGVASYFETPFGAVYGGGGLPSWSNLVAFKYHRAHGLPRGREVLLNVLSDRYFQIARDGARALRDSPDKPAEKVRDDWERARATSWALVYYLVKEQKFDRLLNYAHELAEMPRDLELDQRVLEACFAKAFSLGEAKNALKLDTVRLQGFADGWFQDMETTGLELTGVEEQNMAMRNANAARPPKKNGPPPKGPNPLAPPPPPPAN